MTDQDTTTLVGSGEFVYSADQAWHRVPAEMAMGEAVGVATDSQRRVYVFTRGEQPVLVFDHEGNFLQAWGAGQFVRPHGICIAPDDSLYLTDDQDHTIRKYTPDGQLLMTMGTSGVGSDTGVENADYRTIQRGGPPSCPALPRPSSQ